MVECAFTEMIATGNTLAVAKSYIALGLSIIPVKADGSKTPAEHGWREFTTRLPTDTELQGWFGTQGHCGIGIPGGPASGNLVVLDFKKWLAFTLLGWNVD